MNTLDEHRGRPAHTIRLDSQWDFQLLPDDADPAGKRDGAERLTVVSDCARAAGADVHGRVRLTRRFGRPTNLTPADRVELLIDPLPTSATVALNERLLASLPQAEPDQVPTLARYNVSGILLERNQLVIEVDLPATSNAGVRGVRIEIFTSSAVDDRPQS